MTTQTIPRNPTTTGAQDQDRLKEYHCFGGRGCRRLLFRGILPAGAEIEIRCPKCGRTKTFYGPTNGNHDPIVD